MRPTSGPAHGPAGGSAAAEAARRRANQDARHLRVKAAHPVAGRLVLALLPEPDAGASYASGAVGEQKLGRFLDDLGDPTVLTLHDRRLPRSKANIDHLVVTARGVWVIDAKRYQGRIERAWGELRVNGRRRTSLVTGVHKQVAAVRAALAAADVPEVEVFGVLCFVDADVGLLQRPFAVDGIAVTWPKALRKRLFEPGALDEDDRTALIRHLASAFHPATGGASARETKSALGPERGGGDASRPTRAAPRPR